MRFSHLLIYSDLSVYGKHASIRYAFLFEQAEATKKEDTTAFSILKIRKFVIL